LPRSVLAFRPSAARARVTCFCRAAQFLCPAARFLCPAALVCCPLGRHPGAPRRAEALTRKEAAPHLLAVFEFAHAAEVAKASWQLARRRAVRSIVRVAETAGMSRPGAVLSAARSLVVPTLGRAETTLPPSQSPAAVLAKVVVFAPHSAPAFLHAKLLLCRRNLPKTANRYVVVRAHILHLSFCTLTCCSVDIICQNRETLLFACFRNATRCSSTLIRCIFSVCTLTPPSRFCFRCVCRRATGPLSDRARDIPHPSP
jgi:hypothetical protein